MNLLNRFRLSGRKGEIIIAYAQIILGCIIGGAAYPLFLLPNNIAPGGLTGVAMILNYLFTWPVGLTSFIMNVPLFLIGYKTMGRVFVVRSLFATVLFSVAIDILPLAPMTTDPLLGTLYGGILLGIGLGFILRAGATTGGTDMVARVVHKKMPFLTVGMFLFLIDCIVVVAAGLIMGSSEGLYALICIFLCGKAVDVVMAGLSSTQACFIMTAAWEKVTHRLLFEMDRGVTQLTARGGFSGQERPVVLCVASRQEVTRIKSIVREEDEKAFVFVTEAHETLGEGFSSLMNSD